MTLAYDVSGGFPHATTSNASSISTAISTANAGDIICAIIECNGGPITGVADTSGLTWHFRASSQSAGARYPIEFWWAYAPSALSLPLITAAQTSSDFMSIDVFGVSSTVGFNSSNPFDSNGSLPAVMPSAGADVLVSTTTANSFIIFGYRVGVPSPTAGSGGFTTISGADFLLTYYKIVSAAQTNLDGTIGTGSGTQNGGIGDALIESGGGTVYNVTISEAGSAADVPSSKATYPSTVGETGVANDNVSNVGTFPRTVTEAGSAADTVSDVGTFGTTIAETGAASDTVSNGSTYNSTVTESGTGAETVSDTAVLPSAVAESGAAADTVSDVAVYPSTVTESGTATDTQSTAGTLGAGITETGTAVDTESNAAIFPRTITEAGAAADTPSNVATLPASVSESAPITDSEYTNGPQAAGVTEAASATDQYSAQLIGVATDPASKVTMQGTDKVIEGTREGVDIRVVIRNDRILTAYPTNKPKNP